MNPPSPLIFEWPELPPLPQPGEPVLIRVPTPTSRPLARQELRRALRRVLCHWSGLVPEQLPLIETVHGPQWQGNFDGHSLGISFSYCAEAGWIGLVRGCAIGIDAMQVQPIAEADAVARHYLGPDAEQNIRHSRQPDQTFAFAWTQLEARLKCHKQELTEWNEGQTSASANCTQRHFLFANRTAIAMAIAH